MIQSVGALFLQSRRRWHEKREDEKEKSIWKRIVLGVLLVIKMKFKQGKRKTFNRIRQVAKWIANIRFDSYPRVICKKRLAEKQEV